jgi:glycosyltransferase involved in cell wall biosynthesis
LTIGSLYPPKDSLRHQRLDHLPAPILYAPPSAALGWLEAAAKADGRWPAEMIARHEAAYGASYQSAVRARNALYFASQFQQRGVQHMHVHFANRATHTALFIKKLTGIPFSFTTHGQDFMVDLGSDDLLREMCHEAKFVVAVCDYSRELMARTCPDSAHKIVRIYNGLDGSEFEEKTSIGTLGHLRILSVGRLIEFKGFHVLIDAVAEALQLGITAELRIVGDGPWQERLHAQIAALGLQESVFLLGKRTVEQIAEELHSADVFALGSLVDAAGASDLLPTVITEAMLSGLPVVATRVAGIPEMIAPHVTGHLVPPEDPVALARALVDLAKSPRRAREFGAAGRQLALERFAAAQSCRELLAQMDAQTPDTAPTAQNGILAKKWILGPAEVLSQSMPETHFLAYATPKAPDSCPIASNLLWSAEWVPDGMVLEMEWHSRAAWRQQLTQLATTLGSLGQDASYFVAARRAVWFAGHLEKLGALTQATFHGLETLDSLTLWLTGKITGISLGQKEAPVLTAGQTVVPECSGAKIVALYADARLWEREKPVVEAAGGAAGMLAALPGQEMERFWWEGEAERRQMERWYQEYASNIGGEEFFLAARQAVWLANVAPQAAFYAPEAAAAVPLWLAARLTQQPLWLALPGRKALSGKLRDRLISEASKTAFVNQGDPLLRQATRWMRRLGPLGNGWHRRAAARHLAAWLRV